MNQQHCACMCVYNPWRVFCILPPWSLGSKLSAASGCQWSCYKKACVWGRPVTQSTRRKARPLVHWKCLHSMTNTCKQKNKLANNLAKSSLWLLVARGRLELPTSGLWILRSNQLSYLATIPPLCGAGELSLPLLALSMWSLYFQTQRVGRQPRNPLINANSCTDSSSATCNTRGVNSPRSSNSSRKVPGNKPLLSGGVNQSRPSL